MQRGRSGFLLIESLVGIALFAIFLTAVGGAMLASSQSSVSASDRVHAIMLSERALEGTRSIRDTGFANVTVGDHGVKLGSGALGTRWVFAGTSYTDAGRYKTVLNVSSVATGWVRMTATTTWKQAPGRSGSVVLTGELTDWRSLSSIGSWTSPQLQGSYTDAGTPLFNDVAIYGNYAFVSSEISAGGRGLYVFDISNPASPTRVASSFNLSAAGYELLVKGTTLYILTSDVNQEIRAYDISSPTALSASKLITSYDLPGSGRASAMALKGFYLFVGAGQDATQSELYSFDVSSSGSIILRHQVQDIAAVNGLALKGGFAYIASADNGTELRVADISDPELMKLYAGSGVNVTDVQDGLTVAVAGTSAVLGRAAGASIDELVLFSLENRVVPSGAPGPWLFEPGAVLNDVDIEPGARLAFAAAGSTTSQLRVMDIARWQNGATALRGAYTFSTDAGRGVYYDAWSDKAYVATNRRFAIFRSN